MSIFSIIFGLIAALIIIGFFSALICNSSDSATGVSFVPIATGRSQGLQAAIIQTLPTFLYSQVKHLKIGKGALECAVCLNEFDDDETLRLLPKCDHVFHPECIDAWLSSHVTCPVCRSNLAQPDTVQNSPVSDTLTIDTITDHNSVTIQVVEEAVADEPLRSGSIKSTMWSKFPRSHSTGHSLVQPGENVDRFTLKLPDQIRREIMIRGLNLNQVTSLDVLPRETSLRKGYIESSYRRLGSLDRPDRWMFSMAPPFLTRASSVRKSNRSSSGSEGNNKKFNLIGKLSFNRFGGSKISEPRLI